jgi:hypothetical protein
MLSLAALLFIATPASAATVTNQRPLLFSFDGSDTAAGKFHADPSSQLTSFYGGAGAVAVDDSTGTVYAVDGTAHAVDKFNAEGVAENFAGGPAAGTSSLFGPSAVETFLDQGQGFFFPPNLAVDNSGGLGGLGEGEQGRLYVGGGEQGPIDAFDHEGAFLWNISPQVAGYQRCGMTVDAQGHLWASFEDNAIPPRGKVVELDTTGTATPSLTPIREIEITSGSKLPCGLAVARNSETLYVADTFNAGETAQAGLDKYISGAFDSIVGSFPTRAVTVDQTESSGHVFSVQQPAEGHTKFPFPGLDSTLNEHEPCSSAGCEATLLSSSDAGQIGDARGVAYNPTKDWVYVGDHRAQTIKVFGPRASGAVPTASAGETGGITKTEATAHGIINPGGLSNTYHFELVRAELQKIVIAATGGRFRLDTGGGETKSLPFDIPPAALQAELENLYGDGNVAVSGTAATAGVPDELTVLFKNALAGRFVPVLRGHFLEPQQEVFEEGGIYKGGNNLPHGLPVTELSRGQSWAESEQLPTRPEAYPSIEPPDGADHAVSQSFGGLHTNTPYDVRLVGTNTEPEGDPEKRLDGYSNVDTFTTLPPPSPLVSGLEIPEPTITSSSAHAEGTIDPREDETTWRLLVSTEVPYGASAAECETLSLSAYRLAGEGTIPSGEVSHVDVEGDVTGLKPAQTACVRLLAINGNPQPGIADAVFTTKAVKPTEATLAFVAPRTDTGARLNAYVNPEGGAPLTYRFEYSLDGTTWTALPERISTTESHTQIVVADEVGGLTPDTTYFYRLALVKNEKGEISPESLKAKTAAFTTRTTAEMTLPSNAFGEAEKRGTELVNSPDKGNQNARAAELYSHMSPLRADGEEFLWDVLGGAPGANSGTQATFLAKRTPAGWVSRSLLPPASQQFGGGSLTYFPAAAAPDFSSFIFAPAVPSALTTGPPTLVRLDQSGDQQILDSYQEPVTPDATNDTAHVLVLSPSTGKLEDIGSGSPEEVDLIPSPTAPRGVPQPGGSPPSCGLNGDASFFGGGNSGASSQFEDGYDRMATTDASRVYFQVAPDGGACSGPEALYERNRETEETTLIDPGVTNGTDHDVAMIRAIPDGRSLYFLTSGKLDPADKNEDPDVYRWDEPTGESTAGKSTCLTCGVKNEKGEKITDANVTRRVLVSDDFSHIYFTSTERLIPGLGTQGEGNVYALSGGVIRFVATLRFDSLAEGLGDSTQNFTQLSSDGNALSFLSDQPLTADRVAAQCPNPVDGPTANGPCKELYRYDDHNGSVECVSCRHGAITTASVSLSSFGEAFRASADGSTLAFSTAEALLPLDVNNSADLYEWRNGALRLLTDGVTRYPTGFAAPIPQAVDADGSNIVFSVASPGLTGFERDGVANLYDARIGGGFTPPSASAHCSEESCQGPLQAAPPSTQPGSSGYQGPGNEAAAKPRCRGGKVRRHGRCIARHQRKRSHKRAAHANRGRTK